MESPVLIVSKTMYIAVAILSVIGYWYLLFEKRHVSLMHVIFYLMSELEGDVMESEDAVKSVKAHL